MANWQKEFENATNAETVIALVNDYLGTLSPEMWAWIPPKCTPSTKLKEAEEVHRWHQVVSDECRSPSAIFNTRLQEYAIVFMGASRRLDQLDSARPRSGSVNQ